MITKTGFIRPQSLNNGEIYLFLERNYNGEHQSTIAVKLVNYTPCPAIVIIKFKNGNIQRCLREDLFEIKVFEKYQAAKIEFVASFRHYMMLAKSRLTSIYQDIRIALLNPTG